jgi:osmotically-inducible protein OsmY
MPDNPPPPKDRAEAIEIDITKDLRRSKSFPKNIDVNVSGDEVTLTGAVPTLQDKKTAEGTARAEPGVSRVKNDINIP